MNEDLKDTKRKKYEKILKETREVLEEFTVLAEKHQQKTTPSLRFSPGQSYPPLTPSPASKLKPGEIPEKTPPNHKPKT